MSDEKRSSNDTCMMISEYRRNKMIARISERHIKFYTIRMLDDITHDTITRISINSIPYLTRKFCLIFIIAITDGIGFFMFATEDFLLLRIVRLDRSKSLNM